MFVSFFQSLPDNSQGGLYQYLLLQYLLGLNDGIPQLHKLRTLRFSSIVEGLAGDSHYGKLYVAQERKGLWQINAAPWKPLQKEMLLKTDRKQLRPDFEGVAVRDDGHGTGTIVVSVQGSNAFVGEYGLIYSSLIPVPLQIESKRYGKEKYLGEAKAKSEEGRVPRAWWKNEAKQDDKWS